jgi:hypothetical protein
MHFGPCGPPAGRHIVAALLGYLTNCATALGTGGE